MARHRGEHRGARVAGGGKAVGPGVRVLCPCTQDLTSSRIRNASDLSIIRANASADNVRNSRELEPCRIAVDHSAKRLQVSRSAIHDDVFTWRWRRLAA